MPGAPDPLDTLAARRAGRPKSTGSLQPEPGKCGAKLSYTGTGPENPPRYCRQWPANGPGTRCKRTHSGGARRGIAHPLWKTGTSSKAVPKRIAESYQALLQDDQLLSLRKEIARQRAYYQDLEQRTEDGQVVAPALIVAVKRMISAWRAVQTASRPEATPGMRVAAMGAASGAVAGLEEALHPAVAENASRAELRETWLVLERLTKAENQQVERLYNMITTERAFALRVAETTAFLEAIEKYVADPDTLRAIKRHVAARFEQLARPQDHSDVDAGGRADVGAVVLAATPDD